MPLFEAILFDFDGVLADTEPLHCACWAEVLAPRGVSLSGSSYRQHCIGIADRDMVQMLAAASPSAALVGGSVDALSGRSESCSAAALWRARRSMRAWRLSWSGCTGSTGLAVVSSSSSSEIEPVLTAGGIRQHFDTVVGGESTRGPSQAGSRSVSAGRRAPGGAQRAGGGRLRSGPRQRKGRRFRSARNQARSPACRTGCCAAFARRDNVRQRNLDVTVNRRRLILKPSKTRDLSRRAMLSAAASGLGGIFTMSASRSR